MAASPFTTVATPKAETRRDVSLDHQQSERLQRVTLARARCKQARAQLTPKKRARSSAVGTRQAWARSR